MQKDEQDTQKTKKEWKKPELVAYGNVEKITLTKGFGPSDGTGLEMKGSHPSM